MRSSPWLRAFTARPHALARLVAIPHAGGACSVFRDWHADLPDWLDVIGVQLPGRENRFGEPPLRDIPSIVAALTPELVEIADRPLYLFGHSMGALLAFELCHALERAGASVRHLFVSGRWAPHATARTSLSGAPEPDLHALPTPHLLAAMSELGGIPPAILEHTELLELVLPVLRADLEACDRYIYRTRSPLDCPITALGGDRDPAVDRADLEPWSAHTRRSFDLLVLPGDHFYIASARAKLLWELAKRIGV
jgi:surfactin synthase thioesterase subunit